MPCPLSANFVSSETDPGFNFDGCLDYGEFRRPTTTAATGLRQSRRTLHPCLADEGFAAAYWGHRQQIWTDHCKSVVVHQELSYSLVWPLYLGKILDFRFEAIFADFDLLSY